MSDATLGTLMIVSIVITVIGLAMTIVFEGLRIGVLGLILSICGATATIALGNDSANRQDAENKANIERVETKYDIKIREFDDRTEPGQWLIGDQWRECYVLGGIEAKDPVLMCAANSDGYAELPVGGNDTPVARYEEGAR